MSTTVELAIRRLPDASLVAELRADLPNSRADLGGAPVRINPETLLSLSDDPEVYGATLSAMVFPRLLRESWQRARGHAEGAGHGLHVRVAIEDPSGALHALRWELLRDPITQKPLATQEGDSLARLVVVADLHDAAPPPRPALRALVAVAGPSDAARWGLAPVDVADEAQRALDALGAIPADLLAHGHTSSSGRAMLASLRNGLRKPAHVLYLIAHGRATDAGTTLYLEGDDGSAAPITGADLAESIGALAPASRPLLAVLVACESADQAAAPLASVGPLLARAGVPAVIAMQSQVSMVAAAHFTARLLRELGRDGRIDRALAAARAEMGDEWWAPVLWLRSRDGRLWEEQTDSFSSDALVNIANVQAESVRFGDIAGRDIHHTTINVWGWNHFGEEVAAWLNRLLDQIASNEQYKIQQKRAELEKHVEQSRKIQADLVELEERAERENHIQDDLTENSQRIVSEIDMHRILKKRFEEKLIGFKKDLIEIKTELVELEKKLEQDIRIREKEKHINLLTWKQFDWKRAAQKYRHEILHLYGSIHILDMKQSVPLVDVFTDVYLLDNPSALRRHSIEELKTRSLLRADPLSIAQRHEGGALVAQHKRLFILGQPGAGKTTFLKYLAIQAVQNQLDAIPIFVSLKTWSDSDLDLLSFLIRQFSICGLPNAEPFIQILLTTGQALVLFDGLDEVSVEGGKNRRIIRTIREFAQQYARSQIVITCRAAAIDYTFEQFTYCEMADFTQTEIEAFVGRWFQQHETKREAFLKAFAQPENERLRDLARRPLLLTMLCLSFNETMTFPQRRAELYEEAIDALLKKWDTSRDIQRDIVYRKLSLGHKRQLLAELAAETFDRGEFFIAKKKLAASIVDFLRRLPPPDQYEDIDGEVILRSIEAQHGLLIEQASGIYSFSHLTFQEYFAARYIAEHPREEVLQAAIKQAANLQWREVLLLTASMLDYTNAAHLFTIWIRQLQSQLAAHPPLTRMMEWIVQQAPGAKSKTRAVVLTIVLIDQVSQIYRQLIGMLEDVTPPESLAVDLVKTLVLVIKKLVEINSIYGNILYNDMNFEKVYIIEIESALIIDKTRTQPKTSAQIREHAFYLRRASDHALDIDIERARISAKVASSLISTVPKTLSKHSGHIPQYTWQLTEEELVALKTYLVSVQGGASTADRIRKPNHQLTMPPNATESSGFDRKV